MLINIYFYYFFMKVFRNIFSMTAIPKMYLKFSFVNCSNYKLNLIYLKKKTICWCVSKFHKNKLKSTVWCYASSGDVTELLFALAQFLTKSSVIRIATLLWAIPTQISWIAFCNMRKTINSTTSKNCNALSLSLSY